MKIYLSATMKIRDLNRKFRRLFPYLKLELIRYYHEDRIYSDYYPESASLIEAAGVMKEGDIRVQPGQSAADLLTVFYKEHYLVVHLFSKTVNGWIDTAEMDALTLEQLNEMGAIAYQSARGMAINN